MFIEICEHVGASLQHSVYNSAFASSSCLCSFKVSTGEILGPSQVFPECVHSTMHVNETQIPREYVRALQSLYGHLFPQLFLLSFLVSQLFVLIVNHHLRHGNFKAFAWKYFS